MTNIPLFDFTSDIHTDEHFRPDKKHSDRTIAMCYNSYFANKKSNTLFVLGDIGHYLSLNIQILNAIKKLYGYNKIVLIFGNHDYWLYNSRARYKFKNSFQYINHQKHVYESEGFEVLDGTYIEIDGIKIGGAAGWYDGQFYYQMSSMYIESIEQRWKTTMHDFKYIKGITSFYDMWRLEKPKIDALLTEELDIMCTHIKPTITHRFIDDEYKNDKDTAFYTFDGLESFVRHPTLKLWLYGHTHKKECFEDIYNTGKCLMSNPIGYKLDPNMSVETVFKP